MTTFDPNDLTEGERLLLHEIRGRKAAVVDEIESIRNELASVNNEIESLDIVTHMSDGAKKHQSNCFPFVLLLCAPSLLTVDNRPGEQPRFRAQNLGRKKFNMKPKAGIEFLVDQGLLEYTSEAVAQLLFNCKSLNFCYETITEYRRGP